MINTLLDVGINKYPKIEYIYDFGDNWLHFIEVEKVIDNYDKNIPVCLDGRGDSPPENVGGKYGYADFQEIINNSKHPEHTNALDWVIKQGYKIFDKDSLNMDLKYLL